MSMPPFLVTGENRRFAEFCDACRQYRYIGLCYGSPGVGKTVSARHYCRWDQIEALYPYGNASEEVLKEVHGSDAIFYTPSVTNSPRQIEYEIHQLCSRLQMLEDEPSRRDAQANLEREHKQAEQERAHLLYHWTLDARAEQPGQVSVLSKVPRPRRTLTGPVRLIIVDEADRLKIGSLEQLRDLFDRSGIGLILIGMPGIEKRLARYPQLYSRVGFVHSFRALTAEEVRRLLVDDWEQLGIHRPGNGMTDEEAIAAIVRITGGNFRLLHRLLAQVGRVLEINGLDVITRKVVEAARASLVIGES